MVSSQILVSASFDNGHSLLECLDQILELVHDLVGRQGSDKSVCDLLVEISIFLDFIVINIFPDLLLIGLLELLPLGEGVPESVTGLKLLLKFINV